MHGMSDIQKIGNLCGRIWRLLLLKFIILILNNIRLISITKTFNSVQGSSGFIITKL